MIPYVITNISSEQEAITTVEKIRSLIPSNETYFDGQDLYDTAKRLGYGNNFIIWASNTGLSDDGVEDEYEEPTFGTYWMHYNDPRFPFALQLSQYAATVDVFLGLLDIKNQCSIF